MQQQSRILEIKCADPRYSMNGELERSLIQIRNLVYPEKPFSSIGSWGGAHNFRFGDQKYWINKLKFGVEVLGVNHVLLYLHFDCALAQHIMRGYQIESTHENELIFCVDSAKHASDFITQHAPNTLFKIYLQDPNQEFIAFVFDGASFSSVDLSHIIPASISI